VSRYVEAFYAIIDDDAQRADSIISKCRG